MGNNDIANKGIEATINKILKSRNVRDLKHPLEDDIPFFNAVFLLIAP